MSLINDALKRAKETQQQKPSDGPGGPPLRPVERRPSHGSNLWLLLAFAVIVAVAAILLWQWFQQGQQAQTLATHAPASTQSSPAPSPASPPSGTSTAPAVNVSGAKPAKTPEQVVAPVAPVPVAPNTPLPAVSPRSADAAGTVATTATPPSSTNGSVLANGATNAPLAEATPKPAPMKLQGIIFHPTRPSVVINGKLLFVGDRFGEWRVTAIDTRTVTLAGAGKTNVLTLE